MVHATEFPVSAPVYLDIISVLCVRICQVVSDRNGTNNKELTIADSEYLEVTIQGHVSKKFLPKS